MVPLPQATCALPQRATTEQPQRTRAQRRRRDLTDARAFVASSLADMRCSRCGASDVLAVAPGEIEDRTPLFLLRAEVPASAYCEACWPSSFAAARAA